MRIAVMLSVVAVLALAGCAGHSAQDHAAVRDVCERCEVYVGDYAGPSTMPTVDAETEAAMIRMEQQGRHEHIADIAATIIRRHRSNPQMAFSPKANDLDRQFTRWVNSQMGMDQPWGKQATVTDVAKWIMANKGKLPSSKLLEQEMTKAM